MNSNSVGNLVIEGEGEICHKKRSNGSFYIDTNTSRDYIQVMMTHLSIIILWIMVSQVLSSHTLLDNIYPNKVEDAYYCGGSNETVMPTIYGELR